MSALPASVLQLCTGSAVISTDGKYRYRLARTWAAPGQARPLPFIMLNPSTADATRNDPTILRCMGFAYRLGYRGITVLNLYALRTPSPRVLLDARAAGLDVVGPANDSRLQALLMWAADSGQPVVAAWGNHAPPERVAWLRNQVGAYGLRCLGTTNSGAPKHPLARGRHRIPDDQQLLPWPTPEADAT